MNPKKLVKEYERALKTQPGNIAIRLKLAAVLREVGRREEAVAAYRQVAETYSESGRIKQAIAVCRSVLEFEPDEALTHELLSKLSARLAENVDAAPPEANAAPSTFATRSGLGATPGRVSEPGERPGRRAGASSVRVVSSDAGASSFADEDSVTGEFGGEVTPVVPPPSTLADAGAVSPTPRPRVTEPRVRVVFGDDPAKDILESFGTFVPFDSGFAGVVDELGPASSARNALAVFSSLPNAALLEMQRRMHLRRVAKGSFVVMEGEEGDACFVVLSGELDVRKRYSANPGAASQESVIERLGPGSLFGEFALFADRKRHASVQAVEESELYELPRVLLQELAARYEGVGAALERLFRERLLSTLLRTAPFFSPLAEVERRKLLKRFSARHVQAGEVIVQEGARAGGFFLIVLGTVEISRMTGAKSARLATLSDASYFGEMSLLKDAQAGASVVATTTVELAELSPKDFYEVVSANPTLWQELRVEARRRELANQNIVAGDTAIV